MRLDDERYIEWLLKPEQTRLLDPTECEVAKFFLNPLGSKTLSKDVEDYFMEVFKKDTEDMYRKYLLVTEEGYEKEAREKNAMGVVGY